MNTIEFVNFLRRLDINLFLEGDRLRCNAPEGTLTPTLRSEISDHKAEIISFLQQANLQTNTTEIAPIFRTENNTFPLSFTQEGLWFLYQLQPNSPFYNIPLNLHFSGQLNIAALESSLQLLIDRHEILRTNFITVDGEPVQVINATRDFSLPVVDLRSLSASERDLEYQKLASIAASYVFNLTEEPLLGAKLVQLTPTENVLLLTIHHIIFDGWSVNVFLQELPKIYSALVEHGQPNLPQINLQYVDFAVWQQQWLQGEVLESQLAYWQQKLAGIPELLELPTDRPRPAVQSFRGETQFFTIELDISEALVRLSQQQEVTLFMLLLTAFKVLLYRYTNQPDIVVGSTVANRQNPQIQEMIGFFANTLVLRTDLSDNPTFLELLQQVKKVVLEAYDHQELPFDKLVEALHPERNLSYSPLFQIDFSLEHEATSAINLKDLTINISNPETNHTAKFDLSLSLQKTDRGLTGGFEYSTDLFDAATIARMIGHWQTLLVGIVANPEQKLSDLPILTAIEKQKLLVEWNQTQQDYPQNVCIHQLFESQVEQTPDAIAVIFKDKQLTYRELNSKANQLAHHLQALGVKPETLVGICVERSLEMIIGVLGILKAGGAYVPIDPAYPSECIAYMLDDSHLPILLTQQKLVASLQNHQAQVICLDSDWEEISKGSELAPQSDVTPENLAYVIYTSGSTGKPKGVTIQHQSLVNYIHAVSIEYEIDKCDRILQFASISFDVSAEEIYTSLTSGATLMLRTDSMLDSTEQFLQKCIDWELTVLVLPTAYWHELTAFLSQEKFVLPPSLRLVVIGGEQALTERWNTWLEYVGIQVRLLNNYGPTEATIGATIYDLSKTDPTLTHLPIGRPICNVQTYILDRYLQPVPVGVLGELHIGGVGLARGYLNRPDLTNEKFIPNPFSNDPNYRLYKTGDLVRYLPDGNIEYLGRIDNQVKIRGFRIELGEIEATLSQHPDVQEVAVICREDIPSNKRLVAYVVSNLIHEHIPYHSECQLELDGNTITFHTEDISTGGVGLVGVPATDQRTLSGSLRDYLKQKLPDYMIPSAFVLMKALPLTPNGKIDRRTLRAPDSFHTEQEDKFVAPRTPAEAKLAAIWAEILGLKRIGINDNFFELGGHSLQAASLVSKLSGEMNLKVSVKLLFEHPTIAELAVAIDPSPISSFHAEVPMTKVEKPVTKSLAETAESSPFFQVEQRSLLSLFAVGKLAPVDSAALGYIPLSLIKQTSFSRYQILQDWFDNLPMWDSVMETKWGRIAGLTLPIFEDELYSNQHQLVPLVIEALEMAGRGGAKTVSLTGLIPSATDYGRAIAKAIEGRNDLPKITTGHATTCSAVVLTIKKILEVSQRSLEQEKVAFIGLGSIGISTLRLMLRTLPHPKSIILCDIYSKLNFIESVQQELMKAYGFQGQIQIATSASELPSEIYEATLIIGATNVPDILDIKRLKPGTLIVDDSGPHCFSPEQAIKRFEEYKDILFTEGGVLQASHPIKTVLYLPEWIKNNLTENLWESDFKPTNPHNITGCVLSSLLSSRFEDMEPTVGLVDVETCVQHYQGLERLGFQAADLHCEGYVLQVEPE